MNHPTYTDNASADGDCIVWTEEKPAIVWASSNTNSASKFDDMIKMPMLSYCPLMFSPVEEDLPPKYDSRDRSGRPQPHIFHSLLHAIRFIFLDHLLLKVLAVYLLILYATGNTYLFSPFASSNWSDDDQLMRSHSRDFLTVDIYELYEDTDAWSRSRLGRVGSDSPLLTYSEMQLVGQVEWEVEPNTILDDQLAYDTPEEHAPLPSKSQKKLPLPFHIPSNVFNYAHQLFDQDTHVSTQKRNTRSPALQSSTIYDTEE